MPVDLLVSPGEARNHTECRASHLLPADFPPNALVHVCEDLYVVSPAYGLMANAATASRCESLRLIAEFCGSYALDPGTPAGFAQSSPLVTVAELGEFCLNAREFGRVRGARLFESNLRYAVDSCASPMEAAMVILLCLPGRDGGYKLKLPVMNAQTMGDVRLMDRTHYVGDAVWEDYRLILEYDSGAHHTDQESVAHDKVRSMALEAEGYRVVSVTPPMIMRPEVFHKVALALAGHMGRRMRPERFDAKWWVRHRALRAELFDHPLRWHRLMRAQVDAPGLVLTFGQKRPRCGQFRRCR